MHAKTHVKTHANRHAKTHAKTLSRYDMQRGFLCFKGYLARLMMRIQVKSVSEFA